MGKHLRDYSPGNDALSQVLTWTDLVPDPNYPHTWVVDPETGQRWRRLTPEQQLIAQELVAGANHREACKAAGMKAKPETMSSYITAMLSHHAPFVNEVITLLNEARQSKFVTRESHLRRLDQLGRKAEKEGKYSAAIAAEVSRGRVAGLYAKDEGPKEKVVADSIKALDDRIQELVEKASRQEKEVRGRVVSDNE